MNERIKELVNKAGGEVWQRVESDGTLNEEAYITFDPPQSLEKFTELIVKECIEVFSKDMPDPTSPDYKLGSLNEVVDRVCNVAEHFGVKE
jgi:hypothetical protein